MFRARSPDQLVEFLTVVSGHQDERGATVAAAELTVYLERALGAGRRAAQRRHPHIECGAMAPPAPTARKIRVVVAKPGLDGHDRGAKIIARALRDAGMEVIYTGLHQTPEQIVATVIQEDADAVGLSILSGAHMTLVPRIVELLREQGIDDVLLTVGGTIPGDDIPELKSLGVAEVFTPGAPTQDIIDFIQGAVGDRERT
jgi:methylmalonyl-CoA mutase, C-terminal domain